MQLIHNIRCAGCRHRDGIVKALKPGERAPVLAAGGEGSACGVTAEWANDIRRSCGFGNPPWAEFAAFLEYDVKTRW
jgi:hypothetical protein